MKKGLIVICALCFSLVSFAQKSSIDFEIKNVGITVDGHFNTFSIMTDFDSDGKLNNILGIVEVSSISTGIESRDEHLLEEDYFNAEKHKYITLQSTVIKKKSNESYNVKATLEIKGITKEVDIIVNVTKISEGYKVQSKFEINRKDYKVGGSSFVMSKTVKVNISHVEEL